MISSIRFVRVGYPRSLSPWTPPKAPPPAEIFRALHETSYEGQVSVELEDENFYGSAEQKQRRLLQARDFPETC